MCCRLPNSSAQWKLNRSLCLGAFRFPLQATGSVVQNMNIEIIVFYTSTNEKRIRFICVFFFYSVILLYYRQHAYSQSNVIRQLMRNAIAIVLLAASSIVLYRRYNSKPVFEIQRWPIPEEEPSQDRLVMFFIIGQTFWIFSGFSGNVRSRLVMRRVDVS